MTTHTVDSSMISAIGHDPDSETLQVKFKATGEAWLYENVTKEEYDAFSSSTSVGKHFHGFIKGKKPGRRL